MKEFLSIREIDFISIDVTQDPKGHQELEALGVRSVPIVSRGGEFVHGLVLSEVADFVGISWEAAMLPPQELLARMGLVLATAQRLFQQLALDHLDYQVPGRDRSMKELGFHIFKITEGFLEAASGGKLTHEHLNALSEGSIQTPADLLKQGQKVQQAFENQKSQWQGSFEGNVETYYGTQTLHELLERTCWHAAQHLRQVASMMEMLGLPPDRPLSEADLQGLPVPKEIWG